MSRQMRAGPGHVVLTNLKPNGSLLQGVLVEGRGENVAMLEEGDLVLVHPADCVDFICPDTGDQFYVVAEYDIQAYYGETND